MNYELIKKEIFNLIVAYEREFFPSWAKESQKKVENGSLEKNFRELMGVLGIK